MNARGSLLTRYALFLFKRELSILSHFLSPRPETAGVDGARTGRPRFCRGCWGCIFVAMRLSGDGAWGLRRRRCCCSARARLVTEVLLYEQNKFTWPIFQRIIAPEKFGRAVKDRLGYTLAFRAGTAGARSRRARRSKCGGLCSRACSKRGRRRPSLQAYLTQAPEVKVAGIMSAFHGPDDVRPSGQLSVHGARCCPSCWAWFYAG